jgi:small conductance mechanosensitive channel
LDDENIEIPFPQRSVHVKGLDQMINQMGQAQKLPTTKD